MLMGRRGLGDPMGVRGDGTCKRKRDSEAAESEVDH